MALQGKIKWDEGPLMESGSAASTELHYFVWSDDPTNDDRGKAFEWVRDNAPDTLFGLFKDTINLVERVADAETAAEPYAIWDANVKYVNSQRKKPKRIELNPDDPDGLQDVRISIRSGTGGQLLRTYSIQMVEEIYHSAPWNWELTEISDLLNVVADDDEEGVTMFTAKGIQVPVGTVEIVVETIVSDKVALTDNYLIDAAGWAGKNVINEEPWRGFNKLDLKLINFDASQRGGDEADSEKNEAGWDIVYIFAFSPTVSVTDLNKNPPPGHAFWPAGGKSDWTQDKGGWDYLDTLYVNDIVRIGAFTFSVPQARRMSVHRIYEAISFNLLRI